MSVTEFVQYRRKREGRTNYKKRLTYLKSEKPRLVIRKTNKQVVLQIVEYHPDGDKIICGVTSSNLKPLGWKYALSNLPACYLAGMLLAKKAHEKKVKHAIVDFGLQTSIAGSRLYAALKGAIDGGLDVPADESALPAAERLNGSHISNHFANAEAQRFSRYKSEKLDASKMPADIEAVKKKIMAK